MRNLVLLFLLALQFLKAQNQLDTTNILPKRIISVDYLCLGSSFPIGSFSKRIKTSENSGFANPGLKLDAGFNYQIYKNLGAKAMLVFQNHRMDDFKYKKDLYLENAINQYTIQAGSWMNVSGLFGAYAIFNLDDNFSIQPKVLLGFNYGLSPDINLKIIDSSKVEMNVLQNRGHSFSFCYLLGIDAQIKLINKYYVLIGCDSFNTDLFFENVKVKNLTYGNQAEFKFKQPVQTFGFKLGLGRSFG